MSEEAMAVLAQYTNGAVNVRQAYALLPQADKQILADFIGRRDPEATIRYLHKELSAKRTARMMEVLI